MPPSNHLSLVIDPTGINLRVFPDGDTPIRLARPDFNNQRSANGNLVVGGQPHFYDFECDFFLDHTSFNRLYGLYSHRWSLRSRGLPFETVIYNLAEPFSEIAPSRTRRIVPSTNVIATETITTGLSRFTYWIALQGVFDIEWQIAGDCYRVTFNFVEGTKLLNTD